MYRGIIWNGMLNFDKKVKTIRNQIQISEINQYNTPILTNNPETNFRLNGSVSKKIYRFNLKLNTGLSWFSYVQNINAITTTNNRNIQDIGITLKTSYKKWPGFSITYTKGYSQFNGLTKSNFRSDGINSDFEATLLKYWVYKAEYQSVRNTNSNNQSVFFETANVSLRYQKKNSPFGFEFSVKNLFDVEAKNDYSFSDFFISEYSTYVMPRVFLFSVDYKL